MKTKINVVLTLDEAKAMIADEIASCSWPTGVQSGDVEVEIGPRQGPREVADLICEAVNDRSKLAAIKALRTAYPELSLREAKEMIEATWV